MSPTLIYQYYLVFHLFSLKYLYSNLNYLLIFITHPYPFTFHYSFPLPFFCPILFNVLKTRLFYYLNLFIPLLNFLFK